MKIEFGVVIEKLFVYLRHIRGAILCIMVRVPDRALVWQEAEIRPIEPDTGNAETGKRKYLNSPFST